MAAVTLVNALMGLPPVVVGLAVYLLLSGAGPLGVLQILYTPAAMLIAQTNLVTPIIAALTRQVVEDLHGEYDAVLRSMGAARNAVVEGKGGSSGVESGCVRMHKEKKQQ